MGFTSPTHRWNKCVIWVHGMTMHCTNIPTVQSHSQPNVFFHRTFSCFSASFSSQPRPACTSPTYTAIASGTHDNHTYSNLWALYLSWLLPSDCYILWEFLSLWVRHEIWRPTNATKRRAAEKTRPRGRGENVLIVRIWFPIWVFEFGDVCNSNANTRNGV